MTLKKACRNIASPVVWIWNSFDLRDVFVLGGLALGGYGIYLRYGDWLAYSVSGGLLFLLGAIMVFAGRK